MSNSAVAIIPARSGSKRIIKKNIKAFAGLPIIAHPIRTLAATGRFDRIIVSTDSEEIAEVARQHGAETPFKRPAAIADDDAPTRDVILHALEWLGENDKTHDIFCCVYPTGVFFRESDLLKAFQILDTKDTDSVMSVGKSPFPLPRAFRRDQDGKVIWPDHSELNSNELEDHFYDVGQFYMGKTRAYLERKGKFVGDGTYSVVLPQFLAIDINTPDDWETAELIYTALRAKKQSGKSAS